MIINMSGAGAPGKVVTVHVPPEAGATVTCTNGKKTLSAVTDGSCNAVFKLTKGAWSVTAQKSGVSKTANVNVTDNCTLELSLEQIPVFTYTGEYAIVDDSYNQIDSTLGNWKIRFLTSGTLMFTELNGAEAGIDVFLVGGGGSGANGCEESDGTYRLTYGGGGGYTNTVRGVRISTNTDYAITVGAGGASASAISQSGYNGGSTSAFGATANGGEGAVGFTGSPQTGHGGNGGSGGGGSGGSGGSDGGNGSGGNAGTGQGATTREFGEAGGNLYSGGGGGAVNGAGGAGGGGAGCPTASGSNGVNGTANTGGGGGAGSRLTSSTHSGSGGSGIVIIRNKR